MKYGLSLFSLVFFTAGIAVAADAVAPNVRLKGYRVIHASPQEFVRAMYLPMPTSRAQKERMEKEAKGLDKYFRVKSKRRAGDDLIVEILPEVPLLGSAFERYDTMTVTLSPKHQGPQDFTYAVKLNSKVSLGGTMDITPHPSGSLLTLTWTESSMNGISDAVLAKTIFVLGFLTEKP